MYFTHWHIIFLAWENSKDEFQRLCLRTIVVSCTCVTKHPGPGSCVRKRFVVLYYVTKRPGAVSCTTKRPVLFVL